MLFYLLPQLAGVAPFLGALNVTRYITFRTAAASLTAFAISMLFGPWLIRTLRDFQIGQIIRQEGSQSHRAKAGTPTMGGLLILTAAVVPTLLWADLSSPYIWIAVLATVGFGMVGFLEGALIHGIFHGDLHGGNLFVQPDGRTALLDFGITGRLSQPRRLAFLRLLIAGTTNDVTGQLTAMRDLGALPHDVDMDGVVRDLGLDKPALDPTKLEASARRLYGPSFDALWGELAPVPAENIHTVTDRVLGLDCFPTPGHAWHHVSFLDAEGTLYAGDAAGDQDAGRDDELAPFGVRAHRVGDEEHGEERPDQVAVDVVAQRLEHDDRADPERRRHDGQAASHEDRDGEPEQHPSRDQDVAARRVDEQQLGLHLHARRQGEERSQRHYQKTCLH